MKAALFKLHWKVPASLLVNSKTAVLLLLRVAGLTAILASGGVKSTVQVNWAGEASTRPARSLARTLKMCVAPIRPLYV